ncbi:MAG: four helix bundle protein [Deltaproteobacteria bacterium]|nr:four helix bundle protein [Deltaproteobacteria bacterium]
MEQKGHKSRSYRDLEVWKLSIDFVKKVYQVTHNFPDSEKFGLINQIRRVAVSIPSNIAEGQGRNSIKEFKQFLAISLGSLAELETQLIIAKEIEDLTQNGLDALLSPLDRIRKMIKGLSKGIA